MANLRYSATPSFATEGIVKRFPGVVALDGVDLAFRRGEVHVLLGENGAGKSTLVALLAGLRKPDGGRILRDGRPVSLASPRNALAQGIGVLLQHPVLVPSLRVVDNMALGGGALWRRIPRGDLGDRIMAVAAEAGLSCDPDARVGDLSLGEQRQVALVQALLRGTRLLVLDEVTAMLTPDQVGAMGRLMRQVAAQGVAVLWITHRIDEALGFGDRISVLRHGRNAGELAVGALAPEDHSSAADTVLGLMFGATSSPDPLRDAVRGSTCADRRTVPVFDVRGLTVPDARVPVHDVSFTIGPGEILGIAGIDGHGQTVLAAALAGQRPSAAGTVRLDGLGLDGLDVRRRYARGLGYATDDRLAEGTIGALPVATNLLLKQIGTPPFWRAGVARPRSIAEHARALMAAFDIRAPRPTALAGRLSGGNIQKLLLARELSRRMRVAILAKPTHGLDARNTRAIRDRIRAAALDGTAVLLISSDLEEVLELSHRVGVMVGGRLLPILPNGAGAADAVRRMMSDAAA